MNEFNYFHLNVDRDADVQIRLNDFPLVEARRKANAGFMSILNPHLTGREQFRLTIRSDAEFSAHMRFTRHGEGSVVRTDNGELLNCKFRQARGADALPLNASEDGSYMISSIGQEVAISGEILTRGFDFSSVYTTGPLVNPEQAIQVGIQALLAYENGDLNTLIGLFQPKFSDYAICWGKTETQMTEIHRQDIAEAISEGPQKRDPAWTVDPVSYAGGRLIEVRLNNGPLLVSNPEISPGIRVFVGQRNGNLQILR